MPSWLGYFARSARTSSVSSAAGFAPRRCPRRRLDGRGVDTPVSGVVISGYVMVLDRVRSTVGALSAGRHMRCLHGHVTFYMSADCAAPLCDVPGGAGHVAATRRANRRGCIPPAAAGFRDMGVFTSKRHAHSHTQQRAGHGVGQLSLGRRCVDTRPATVRCIRLDAHAGPRHTLARRI